MTLVPLPLQTINTQNAVFRQTDIALNWVKSSFYWEISHDTFPKTQAVLSYSLNKSESQLRKQQMNE